MLTNLPYFSKAFVPQNYRETLFHFSDGLEVSVAGLACPSYCRQNVERVMHFLRNQKVHCIYGLEPSPEFASCAQQFDLLYIGAATPDFKAPDISLYDKIYEKILEEAYLGKKVAIHCMGGNGRTGTVLAALKLKELSAQSEFYKSQAKEYVQLPCASNMLCTENVAKALCRIRSMAGNEEAVESQEQIKSLMLYEEHLRQLAQKVSKHGPQLLDGAKLSL